MTNNNSTDTQSEREIVITRVFDAPRSLVFKAWTDPKHVAQWWGPKGFTTRVTELDLHPGGKWRYVMIGPDGTEYPAKGVFYEIVPLEQIVTSDEFDQGFEKVVNADLPRGIVMTAIFEDLAGKTKLTLRIMHESAEERRKHEEMGVIAGWNSSFECLDEHLVQMVEHKSASLTLTLPSEREIVMTRVFDAPRRLVFDAWTKPEHLPHWMTGPEGWTMPVCEIDLSLGGAWHFVWRDPDGTEMEMRGVYKEITPPERLVSTESWGNDWPETLNTLILSEEDGKTTMTNIMLYPSQEARDAALRTGMKEGTAESCDRLDRYLRTMV
jgi:uncharacterized protein YndB with AHSA1/START domain